jgi:uncharacterized protein involved in outer membrane biogenesis
MNLHAPFEFTPTRERTAKEVTADVQGIETLPVCSGRPRDARGPRSWVAAVFLPVNAKPWIEPLASEALDMEVRVRGRLAIGFRPRLHVALADVHARKRGDEVASVKEVELGFELLPLLHREVRINSVGLKQLRLAIERGRDGKLNVRRSSRANGTLRAQIIESVSVSDATLRYADHRSGQEIEAAGCTVKVSRLRFSSGGHSDVLKNLSVAGKLACDQIRTRELTAFDVRLSVEGKDGIFDFDPVTMGVFGGRGSGTLRADVSGAVPVYHVRYGLTQFRIEEFFKTLSPKTVGEGAIDFRAKLALQGKTLDALKRSLAGEASVHGQNLRLAIGDLDKKFARYESIQSFNLVDVGAVFFAGPLALAVTKGFGFARIFEGSDGSTPIQHARFQLARRARRRARDGCSHGDAGESGRPEGRARFRQRTIQ